jgi:hypothetical protein
MCSLLFADSNDKGRRKIQGLVFSIKNPFQSIFDPNHS